MTDPLTAELGVYLAKRFPDLDVAAILRNGADVVPGELGGLLAATAEQIPIQEDDHA